LGLFLFFGYCYNSSIKGRCAQVDLYAVPGRHLQSNFDTANNAINTKLVGPATNSAIGDNLKLVAAAGTRETLVASTTPCKSVVITAKLTNTGTVVVGGSTVVAASGATRRGAPLSAGDSVVIDIDDLVKIYLDVTVSGEGVTFAYVA
jgi:hypothetical protein